MNDIFRAGLAAAWIVCAALLAAALVPYVWQGAGGRDERPAGIIIAITLVASGVVLRRWLGWSWRSLLGGLLVVQGIALVVVAYFSGEPARVLSSPSNLLWLGYMNQYIGVPWIVGIAVGSVLMRASRGGADHSR